MLIASLLTGETSGLSKRIHWSTASPDHHYPARKAAVFTATKAPSLLVFMLGDEFKLCTSTQLCCWDLSTKVLAPVKQGMELLAHKSQSSSTVWCCLHMCSATGRSWVGWNLWVLNQAFFWCCRGNGSRTPFPVTRKESRIFKYFIHGWKQNQFTQLQVLHFC